MTLRQVINRAVPSGSALASARSPRWTVAAVTLQSVIRGKGLKRRVSASSKRGPAGDQLELERGDGSALSLHRAWLRGAGRGPGSRSWGGAMASKKKGSVQPRALARAATAQRSSLPARREGRPLCMRRWAAAARTAAATDAPTSLSLQSATTMIQTSGARCCAASAAFPPPLGSDALCCCWRMSTRACC